MKKLNIFNFKKNKKNPKDDTPQVGSIKLFKYTDKKERIWILVGTIFGLLQAVTQAVWLQTYSTVVNEFTAYGNLSKNYSIPQNITDNFKRNILLNGVTVFLMVGLINVFLVFVSTWSWSYVADRHIRRIRQNVGWFDLQSPGDLNIKLSEDIYNIWAGTGDKIADILLLTSKSLGGIVMAFISGWKMTIVFISFLPLVAGCIFCLIMIIKIFTQKEMKSYGKAGYVAEEVLSSIRTVHAFNGIKKEERRYEMNLSEARSIGIRKGLMIGIGQLSMNVFLYASFAVLVWYGPYLIRTEPYNYTPGTVMVVFFGVLISTFSLGSMAPNIQSFAEARASAAKVFEIIEQKSLIDVTKEEGIMLTPSGHIELKNIKFRYPARVDDQIFEDLSLEIKPKQSIALVGSSGCGKSTILQLIQRFYDPEEGQILFDGHDLRDINLGHLRSCIGIVSQEPILFFGSIAENIELGKPGSTKEEIIKAATISNAHSFITELPMGYDTIIGERGAMLSGGQKQRIAIARAILSQPKILLLDEATSALDTESEKLVQTALENAGESRTTITVAHRLSTIKNSDLIYVLDRGNLIEKGVHSELMAKKGLYYQLVTAQSTESDKSNVPKLPVVKYTSSIDESDAIDSSDEDEVEIPTRISFSTNMVTGKKKSKGIHKKLSRNLRRFTKSSINNLRLINDIFSFNIPEIPYIICGVLCAILVAAVLPIFSVIFTELFNVFTMPVEDQISITRKLSIGIFFLGLIGGLATLGYSYFLGKSGEELTFRMRSRSFSSMASQDMAWFDMDDNRVGALLTRLSLDASQLKGMTGQRLAVIIQSLSFIIIGGTLCFVYSWQMTLTMLALTPLILISGIVQGQKINRTSQKDKKSKKSSSDSYEEEAGKVASEVLNNIRTIVSLHQENLFVQKYEYFFKQLYKQNVYNNWKIALGNGVSQSILFFIYAVAIGVGVQLLVNGMIEFYIIFRIIALVNMVGSAIGRGSVFLVDFDSAKSSAKNILKVIRRKPAIDSLSSDGIIPETLNFDIKGKDLSFAYPTRPNIQVLQNIAFNARDKQATAFVGPSGCGKSTIIGLLLRFYNQQSGEIFLGNDDIRTLNISWLRSKIGFVQQEPILFDLTIEENILYGIPEDSTNENDSYALMEEAAKAANIHDDIIRMPLGYKTKVGTKGTHLSGGQKQRIAIARALIRNPSILLLDEATSALDTNSEKIVQAALDNAQKSRTTISIAHRLATIKNCDQIIVINSGGIVESGSHDQLINLNGLYSQLASAQSMT